MRFSRDQLEINVKDLLSHDYTQFSESEEVEPAVNVFRTNKNAVVLLTDADGKLSGVITAEDLPNLAKVDPNHAKAKDIATKNGIVAISDNAQMWQILKILNGRNRLNRKFDCLPVVDDSKKLVGMVTRKTLRNSLGELVG